MKLKKAVYIMAALVLALVLAACGADGEENQGLCVGTENFYAINAKAAADRTGPDAEPHGVADLCRELWPEAF